MGGGRRVRCAVPAVLDRRPVRGRAAGPLGSPGGAGRGEPRTAGVGDRRRGAARRRGTRHDRALRCADRQRVQPVRHLRTVGGAAARRPARAGRDDELRRHRDRGHRHLPRCEFHAAAPLALRLRRCRCRNGHAAGGHSRRDRVRAVVALSPTPVGARRHRARRARVGLLRRGHRVAVRRPHRAEHPDGRGHLVRPGQPPHGVRDQHPAGAGDRAAQRHSGRRRAGHRRRVRRGHRQRRLPGQRLDPDGDQALGPVRDRQRRRCCARRSSSWPAPHCSWW